MKRNKDIINLFLILGLLFIFFLPAFDPDLGWQIRCGEEFWQKGTLCSKNTFSVLLESYHWPNHSLGYQILLFPFYKVFGLWGLSLANSILLTAIIFVFLKLNGSKNLKIIFLPIILLLSWSTFGFGIRGQLLGLLFFFALFYFKDTKKYYLFPLLMLFWANSHGSFLLGVAFLVFLIVENGFFLLLKKLNLKTFFKRASLALIAIAATFITPFGIKLHLQGINHIKGAHLETLIAEWVSPVPIIKIIIALLFVLCLFSIYKRKKQWPIFESLVVLSLVFLSFKARRNVPLFIFFSGYSLSFLKFKKTEALAMLSIIGLFVFGFFYQLPKTALTNLNWENYCKKRFACEAVAFLKEQNAQGNIFNTYEQGGFLIWQRPEQKIFVDGRMPAWPTPEKKSPYTIYLETLQTQPGWQETLDTFKIEWLFIGPGTFMDLKIRDDPSSFGFEEKYRDKRAAIYRRL